MQNASGRMDNRMCHAPTAPFLHAYRGQNQFTRAHTTQHWHNMRFLYYTWHVLTSLEPTCTVLVLRFYLHECKCKFRLDAQRRAPTLLGSLYNHLSGPCPVPCSGSRGTPDAQPILR